MNKVDKEVSLIVKIEVQDGKRDQQIKIFNQIQPLVLAEKGCLQYELKAVAGNENQFYFVEKWASEEDLEAHANSAHMLEAKSKNDLFRAKPAELIRLVDI